MTYRSDLRAKAFSQAVEADRRGDRAGFIIAAREWLTLLAQDSPENAGCTPEAVPSMSYQELLEAVFG